MRQHRFTMIELFMVIVILGILAATALPKFANLQGDARKSSLEGAYGAVKSAMNIAYSQSLIEGKEANANASVELTGKTINTVYGYPSAADIDDAAQLDSNFTAAVSGSVTTISLRNNCGFTYTTASSATSPATVSALTNSGC